MRLTLKFSASLPTAFFLCFAFCAARACDPNKPFIYEYKISVEMDKWFNCYSTAMMLSRSDNTVAFQVVAKSTMDTTSPI